MKLYKSAEAAEQLGVTQRTLTSYLASGLISAHRLGPSGSLRFTETDLESVLVPYSPSRAKK